MLVQYLGMSTQMKSLVSLQLLVAAYHNTPTSIVTGEKYNKKIKPENITDISGH